MNEVLEDILQAVLFAAEEPLSVQRLRNLFEEEIQPEVEQIQAALDALLEKSREQPVCLVKVGKGYRYQTHARFSLWINQLYATKPPKLSRALLETLAIIAYRQPATRGDIQAIRGISVSSDIMQRLLERGWVKVLGRKEVPGRPSIYGTTDEFLSYFGLDSLKNLPALREPRELHDIATEMNLELPFSSAAAEQNQPHAVPIENDTNTAPDSTDADDASKEQE